MLSLPGLYVSFSFHLLVERQRKSLMRQINGVYTQAFNRRHSRGGHVLQGCFKAIVVDWELPAGVLPLCRTQCGAGQDRAVQQLLSCPMVLQFLGKPYVMLCRLTGLSVQR